MISMLKSYKQNIDLLSTMHCNIDSYQTPMCIIYPTCHVAATSLPGDVWDKPSPTMRPWIFSPCETTPLKVNLRVAFSSEKTQQTHRFSLWTKRKWQRNAALRFDQFPQQFLFKKSRLQMLGIFAKHPGRQLCCMANTRFSCVYLH